MCFKKVSRYFICCFIILMLPLNSFSKKKIHESSWINNPLKVDGSSDDWKDIKLNELKKYKIDYAFRNDSKNLYIVLVFKDFKFLSTIRFSGITVWLNSVNKKSKTYGIKMQKRMITPEAFIALVEKKHGPLSEKQKNDLKKRRFYSIYRSGIISKKDEAPVPIKLASDKSPSFRVNLSKNTMIYEFRIPMAKIEGEVAGIGTIPGKKIMIGFEWGGMTKEIIELRKKKRSEDRSSDSKEGVSSTMPGSSEFGGGRIMDAGAQPSQVSNHPYFDQVSPSHAGPSYPYTKKLIDTINPKRYSIWMSIKLALKE